MTVNNKNGIKIDLLCTDVLRLELRRSDAKSVEDLIATLTKHSTLIQAISEGRDYEL